MLLYVDAVLATLLNNGRVAGIPAAISLGPGFEYNSKNCGLTSDTSMLIIPSEGKYKAGAWAFKLTVPYIQIR